MRNGNDVGALLSSSVYKKSTETSSAKRFCKLASRFRPAESDTNDVSTAGPRARTANKPDDRDCGYIATHMPLSFCSERILRGAPGACWRFWASNMDKRGLPPDVPMIGRRETYSGKMNAKWRTPTTIVATPTAETATALRIERKALADVGSALIQPGGPRSHCQKTRSLAKPLRQNDNSCRVGSPPVGRPAATHSACRPWYCTSTMRSSAMRDATAPNDRSITPATMTLMASILVSLHEAELPVFSVALT